MNNTVSFKRLLCIGILFLSAACVQAADSHVISAKDQPSAKPAQIEVKDADTPSLMPVPEPSAVSLVFLGVGAALLAMRLRKRA
jgi:hypothetical protein